MILFRSVRELASQALHNLTPTDPEFMAKIGNTEINFQQSGTVATTLCAVEGLF